jgi:hypothetical protein
MMTYARVSSAWAKLIASLFPSLCVVRPGKTDHVPVSVLIASPFPSLDIRPASL